MTTEMILIESPAPAVKLIRLNRPKQYNALNTQLLNELKETLEQFEKDDSVAVVVITGSEKAFAAGADINELASKSAKEMFDIFEGDTGWHAISKFSKPILCAASGMALGGGFELALQCDVLWAAEETRFALPEVNLGVIPGAGGTQRITKILGKSLAMEMILSARPLFAEEACQRGIVSRVVAADKIEPEIIELAKKIASKAPLAVKAGKNAVNRAMLGTLEAGLEFEKDVFCPLFDSSDAKKLMADFMNK